MIFATMFLLLSGCRRDIPEPESKIPITTGLKENTDDLPVTGVPQESSFQVLHQVKGNNVRIECKLKDISFRNDHPNKQRGKIIVYVDGRKTEEFHSPVFIIKGLTKGNHSISLEVVNQQNRSYLLKNEIMVVIP
jgi:hypothetical protein